MVSWTHPEKAVSRLNSDALVTQLPSSSRRMCKVDQRMAVKYYEDSAVLGYEPAQCKLAKCYEFGYGCEKDKQKSLFWYEKAAENGNMEAQYKVGISYDFGRGCAIDKSKALMWYRKAAVQGHKEAREMLVKNFDMP